jgi:hypothetical protein
MQEKSAASRRHHVHQTDEVSGFYRELYQSPFLVL